MTTTALAHPLRGLTACLTTTALLAASVLAHAQSPAAPASATPTATVSAAAPALPQVEAEVRRIDARGGKITLKHGNIPNLDMPPMTMVFQVRSPAQLGNLKPGDKIRFSADKINGAYTVIELEAVPPK